MDKTSTATLIVRLKKLKRELSTHRDQMREVLDEYETVFETAERAEEGLQSAIDALSEYV